MERNEISLHQVLIYRTFLNNKTKWLTVREVMALTKTVAHRTVTQHIRNLLHLGLLDQAEVFPAHKYRWAEKGDKRNPSYVLRLKQADEVFGTAA